MLRSVSRSATRIAPSSGTYRTLALKSGQWVRNKDDLHTETCASRPANRRRSGSQLDPSPVCLAVSSCTPASTLIPLPAPSSRRSTRRGCSQQPAKTEAAALWPSRLTPAPATPLPAVDDVRAGVGRRVSRQGLLVLAHKQPHGHRPRKQDRRARGRLRCLATAAATTAVSPSPPSPPVFTATLTAAANLAAAAFSRPPSRPPLPTPPRL